MSPKLQIVSQIVLEGYREKASAAKDQQTQPPTLRRYLNFQKEHDTWSDMTRIELLKQISEVGLAQTQQQPCRTVPHHHCKVFWWIYEVVRLLFFQRPCTTWSGT